MSDFYTEWSQAKADFARSKALFPAPLLANLDKGANLGPALKTFDKASAYEARAKALMSVRTAKQQYDALIRQVQGSITNKDSAAYKALGRLDKSLQDIWLNADKLAQPPKPGGSAVPYEVIRNFNLAAGVKPKHLSIAATQVNVVIEVDNTLDAMIKAGEESLKINHLGDVAKSELDKVGDSFAKTMATIDAKIEGLDSTGRAAKVKEANEVLNHYAKIVEARVDAAIQAEWKAYLQRKAYLSSFRLKSGLKITFGVIGIGVAAASLAMSFGTMWMNIVGIAKTISDMAQTIKTWAQDLEKVYELLYKDIETVHKLNLQREEAKKKGLGQKASKTKEAAKELLTGLLPITKSLMNSASSVEDRSKQLLGLVSKLETQSDKLVAQLNAATKLMSGLPEKHMNSAMKQNAEKLRATFEKLFSDITDLHTKSQNCAKFGDRALKAAQKLRKEDSWSGGFTSTTVGLGTKGAALVSLANFAYECAKNGASFL